MQVTVRGGGELSDKEISAYIDYGLDKFGTLKGMVITVDGDYVELNYDLGRKPFERIRRIKTGGYMKVISKHRGEGKTTDIVLMSAQTGIPILLYMSAWEKTYYTRAQELGVTIPKPIKYEKGMKLNTKVLIDEIDMFLRHVLDLDVYAATTNKVDELTKWDIAKRMGVTVDDFEIVLLDALGRANAR